ncbi:hypothetical protein J1N35_010432 [Gossypium stocksii]|uniref:Uncharacterized protein n=1 Tax=Gossypium stocksii TaxID=47602 RepID=A0A9D4AC15_9ROSI|nr:hypothetical protein J1N35_010432 [Gossypium stocksii]
MKDGWSFFEELEERQLNDVGFDGKWFTWERVFFSKNTSEEDRILVVNLLGICSSNEPERYLGLPNMRKDFKERCAREWAAGITFLSGKTAGYRGLIKLMDITTMGNYSRGKLLQMTNTLVVVTGQKTAFIFSVTVLQQKKFGSVYFWPGL